MKADEGARVPPPALRIVYVGGWMRSGTTLLCEMLGAFQGALSLGELSGIWRAADRDEPCSCGRSILECPVWGPALAAVEAEHGVRRTDYDEWALRAREVLKTRQTRMLSRLVPGEPEQWPPHVRKYVAVLGTLLGSIQEATGATALVDSSKLSPGYLLVRLLPGAQVDVVHIVRDARAVANSERKTRVRLGPGAELLPPGHSAVQSVLFWSGFNVTVRAFAGKVDSYYEVDYESLTTRADEELGKIAAHLGMARTPGVMLESGHIAVGNPARLAGPGRSVVTDESWKTELAPATKLWVTVASLPARGILRAGRSPRLKALVRAGSGGGTRGQQDR